MKTQKPRTIAIALSMLSALYMPQGYAETEAKAEVERAPQVEILHVQDSSTTETRSSVCETIIQPTSVRSTPRTSNTGNEHLLGEVIGGAAGGLIGARVGKGNGRTAAAAAGALVGTIVGNRLSQRHYERQSGEVYENEPRIAYVPCPQKVRIDGHIVVFSVAGEMREIFIPSQVASARNQPHHRYR